MSRSMLCKVKNIDRRRVFDGFLNIDELDILLERSDGNLENIKRLSLERGDCVAAIVIDRYRKSIWLVEQLRAPTLTQGVGWMEEIPAGVIDPGETPEAAVRREVGEEIGYGIDRLEEIGLFYTSPGGSSERVHLFLADIDSDLPFGTTSRPTPDAEEDITIKTCSVDDFITSGLSGHISDAKTLIAALWLAANRARLGV